MRFPGLPLLAILPLASDLAAASLVFENTVGAGQVNSAGAIGLDSQGNIYVAGSQSQTSNGGFGTAFVDKWSPDGSQLLYTTSFGGSGYTVATGIAVDSAGSAYVTGYTSSPDFPVTSNAFQKNLAAPQSAFVTKFSPDGSRMVYSTLLGGAGSARAYAQALGIAVDSGGNAIVTGATQGTNFPVTTNAFQSAPVSECVPNTSYINISHRGRRIRHQDRSRWRIAGVFDAAGRELRHFRTSRGAGCERQRVGHRIHFFARFPCDLGRAPAAVRQQGVTTGISRSSLPQAVLLTPLTSAEMDMIRLRESRSIVRGTFTSPASGADPPNPLLLERSNRVPAQDATFSVSALPN